MSGRFSGSRGGRVNDGYDRGGRGGRGGRGDFRGGRGGSRVQVYESSNPDRSVPRPNAQVAKVEDLYGKSLSSNMTTLQPNGHFPRRPGYGTKGQPVTLWANYIELLANPNLVLYRYRVNVSPAMPGQDPTGQKLEQIVRLLIESPAYADFRDDMVSDFKSTLLSRRIITVEATKLNLSYKAEGEDKSGTNASQYLVRVELTGTLMVSHLIDHLASTNSNSSYAEKEPVLQALNIFLSHFTKSSSQHVTAGGKSYSLNPTTEKLNFASGLVAMRGFFSSVRLATARILVNVNVSVGLFYDPINLDLLIERHGLRHPRVLESFLKKVRITVNHLDKKVNRAGQVALRTRTISGLATPNDGHGLDHPPQVQRFGAGPKDVKFFFTGSSGTLSSASKIQATGKADPRKKREDQRAETLNERPIQKVSQGRYITVFDFFKQTHGWSIRNPDLPVVNVGNRERPIYLPAEVCSVVPGQNMRTRLDEDMIAKIQSFASRKPWQCAQDITQQGLGAIGLLRQTNTHLDRFGLIPKTEELITVNGRVLPAPRLLYRGQTASVRNGGWNMSNYQVNEPRWTDCWSYLMISETGTRDAFDNQASLISAMGELRGALRKLGIMVPAPVPGRRIQIQDYSDEKLEHMIRDAPGDPLRIRLLIIILPHTKAPLYNRVKELGDVRFGVLTICLNGPKFSKCQPDFLANVGLKFNVMFGGVNQLVEENLGLIGEDKTMVVGIDVTHPSMGSAKNAPSIAAMAASTDKSLGQWPADVRIQTSRQEMVNELDSMLRSRLLLWKTIGNHKVFPNNILVYRDGVSEGEYQTVLDSELPLLRRACERLYPAPDTKKGFPHITLIIVGKRHHTRFYPTNVGDASTSANPVSGTIVDRGVTESHLWNFFLQSHHSILGTARPAHYFILLDEIFTPRKPQSYSNAADELQNLTHSMCFTFSRATKAISTCPPARYAHLVCERARRYLSGIFDVDTSSVYSASNAAEESGNMTSENSLVVHQLLKDTMFYI